AGIKNPGLFSVVKQECIRRSKLKEGHLSLSPKVVTDVVVAFATAKILDDDLFEVLMLRAVSLMDCPLRQELVPDVCAPATSSSGNKLPAVAFSLQDLVQVCKAFVDLRKVDREFFEDVANYACRAFTSPDVALCEWFVGNPNVTLPQIASIFAKAEVLQLDSLDFFAHLKTMMMRRKEELRPHSLKKFQHAWHMHKSRQEKQERQRSQPPQRRRGAMGRAYVEDKPAVQHQSRTEKARQQRQRLAAMTEEEVLKEVEEAEKHAGTSASAKLLLSGFKVEALLEAQEGPKEGKKTKSEIMEASTSISIRSMVKGKKARNEEVSASAKAEARKHARGRR
ncbi:pks3, partial [Symbiodinium necroappetens]